MLNLINRWKILTIYLKKGVLILIIGENLLCGEENVVHFFLWGRILPPLPWTSVLFIQNIEYDFKSKTNLR